MSSLSKLRKNAENFRIQQIYNNMTPEQYQQGIANAYQRGKVDVYNKYKEELERMQLEYNKKLKDNSCFTIDTISVELLYEIANQMNFWDLKDDTEDEKYIKESAKYRIQQIYENTMNAITNYTNIKKEGQARKIFQKKKKQVEKEFNIKF